VKLVSHLSRITTPGRAYIPQIDGLRFIAIMSVIAGHVLTAYQLHISPGLDSVKGDWVYDFFAPGMSGCNYFSASADLS
jgi:peptidoglycan/LPS O-acetylase OafA/YrhL